VAFQPHRYSRTKSLLDSFAASFKDADELILTNIYSAWEKHSGDVSVKDLYQKILIAGQRNVHIIPRKNITNYLYETAQPHDLILILGAGDIGDIAGELADCLKKDEIVN